jgi:hypothetical protein
VVFFPRSSAALTVDTESRYGDTESGSYG